MIRYIDPLLEVKHRHRARSVARRLKEGGFDASGDCDNTLRFEAVTFRQKSERPELKISAELADVLIREEFEKLYGMSPQAYGKIVAQEQALKDRPGDDERVENYIIMKLFEEIMGREE
jgi:hypothetical protein